MPGESLFLNKWWHPTLNIFDIDPLVSRYSITSISATGASVNRRSDVIFAYVNNQNFTCDQVAIPVASFDDTKAGGYFLFAPKISELVTANVHSNITNYNEASNLSNRKYFNYVLTAAYNPNDADCNATVPTRHDTYVYDEVWNNVTNPSVNPNYANVIHKYANMEYVQDLGCCTDTLGVPVFTLPSLNRTDLQSVVYFLIDKSTVNGAYSIVSYDFRTNTKTFRGYISLDVNSIVLPPNLNFTIYDIAWLQTSGNRAKLFCVTNYGFFPLNLGNSSRNCLLEAAVPINLDSRWTWSPSLFPNEISLQSGRKAIECHQDYMFLCIEVKKRETDRTIVSKKFLIQLDYANSNVFTLREFREITSELPSELTVPANFILNPDINNNYFYGIQSQSTVRRLIQFDVYGNLMSNINTLDFIPNNCNLITRILNTNPNDSTVMYAITNAVGQMYTFTLSGASINNLLSAGSLGEIPLGSSGTYNSYISRSHRFPFDIDDTVDNFSWVFVIDTSTSMIGQNKLGKIVDALNDFVLNYPAYNDQVRIVFFDNTFKDIQKTCLYYSDLTELSSFISNNSTPIVGVSNATYTLNVLATNVRSVRRVIFFSAGQINDSVNPSTGVYDTRYFIDAIENVKNGFSSISSRFMCVDVSPTASLQQFAEYFDDYVNWV